MIHLQRTVPGWLEAVSLLPDKSCVKAVDQVQAFEQVKAINPNLATCLRHFYDRGQIFGGTYAENKQKARDFFATFIDGTFMEYAKYVDYIEEWNEYLANSQTPEEVADRVRWATACADVWDSEYRVQPELEHIRLVLCNTAVGNWIDRDFAIVASNYDAVIGYHPYTLWQNGVRWGEDEFDTEVWDTQDWYYLSGLWDTMEHDWGIKVDWLFTEAGPFESAVDGWRSSNCLGGDRDKYVNAVRDWIYDVRLTPAYKEGRVKGFNLFTTGRASDTWKHFWTEQPELNMLAEMVAHEWFTPEPPIEPPVEPPEPEPCHGAPREQYKREYWVLSGTMTPMQEEWVFNLARQNKITVGWSYDDAGIGDLDIKKAVLWNIADDLKQAFTDWFNENYPGVTIEFRQTPDTSRQIIDIVEDLPSHPEKSYSKRPLSGITTLVIHHTVSPPDRSIESIAAYHVNTRDWPGIGYHYVISDDGTIYQTNYLETKSYHAGTNAPGDENAYTVGIALQGDFTHDPPPQAQLDATKWLVGNLNDMFGGMEVVPHKYVSGASTACPGATWEEWFEYISED